MEAGWLGSPGSEREDPSGLYREPVLLLSLPTRGSGMAMVESRPTKTLGLFLTVP